MYCAESVALAVLEVVIHEESFVPLMNRVVVPAEIADHLIVQLDQRLLPSHWRAYPHPAHCRALGHRWLLDARSPALEVPSAVVPQEKNYLLNPAHPRFSEIRVGKPIPLDLDPRLTSVTIGP